MILHLAVLLSLAQGASNEPSQLAWADFTGDELPDLAAVHPNGAISLYKNTGDGAFEEVTTGSALKDLKGAVSIEWSDLDGDKDVDLLVTTRAGVRLFENNERRSLHEATPNSPLSKLNSPLTKVSLHDFDKDGLIDLELSTEREHSLWHNKGKWSFEQVSLQLPPSLSPRAEIQPGVLPPGQPAPGKAPAGEITERDPNGGQAQSTISSSGTYLGGGGVFQVAASAPICAGTIEDASQIGTGVCIPASSIPMAGHLYPLGTEFFIDPSGRVGIGTDTPSAVLDVRSNAASTTPDTSDLDIKPNVEINGNSELFMGEDIYGNYGMRWRYDGDDNQLSLRGRTATGLTAPLLSVARDTGDYSFIGDGSLSGSLTAEGPLRVNSPAFTPAEITVKSGTTSKGGFRNEGDRLTIFVEGSGGPSGDDAAISINPLTGRVGIGVEPTLSTLTTSSLEASSVRTPSFVMTSGASAGEVLTCNDEGLAYWLPAPISGLSGSGAANTIALWDSAGGLTGSSTLTQGSSGELDVNGDTTVGGLLTTTEKLSVHSASGTTAELKLRNGNSWTGGIRQASNNRLSLFNGGSSSGTNRLTITENGLVGIGSNITTPNNLLSVYGTTDIQGNLELENSADENQGRINFKNSQGSLGPDDGGEVFMYSDDTLVMDNNEDDGSIKLRINNENSKSIILDSNGDVFLGGSSYDYLNSDLSGTAYGNGAVITSSRHKTRLDLNNSRNSNDGPYGDDGGDSEIRFMTDEVVHFSMGVNERWVAEDTWPEKFVISGPSAASNPPVGTTPAKGDGGVGSNPFLVIEQNGNIGVGTFTPDEKLDVDGTTKTKYLEITAGADLVERFEGDSELITPGKLVAIDPENPKHIRLTTGAYDSTVLGVLSGAGGINHGIALGQEGVTTGDLPVAMVGRVYAECSAENGPIRPGDLLTSSSVPGVGMKATDTEASFGAVIGKALTGLDKGSGLVLVVVNLQ